VSYNGNTQKLETDFVAFAGGVNGVVAIDLTHGSSLSLTCKG